MGFSIGKVFRPVEEEMKTLAEVDSLYLPIPNYSLKGLWHNIKAARNAVRDKNYDIIHITGSEHYLIPFLPTSKVIVTVHDFSSLVQIQNKIKKKLKFIMFVKTLTKARAVTFISESTDLESRKMVNLTNVKTCVIHDPVGNEFVYSPKEINQDKINVLHIGTKPNKNLERSIEVFSNMNIHLRIVGKLNEQQIALLNKYNIDYSNVFNISDEQILYEYRNCDIVNFPSTYEGFGMPIIEGNAIGRVVVTSNISPMKDVAEGSCPIVDPYDMESIGQGYRDAVENYDFYVSKGLENAKRFRVNTITKQYYNLYSNLIK